MTREHKLALIVGFALVLVVGVLISDHFSTARHAQVATEITSGSATSFGNGSHGLNIVSAALPGTAVGGGGGSGATDISPPAGYASPAPIAALPPTTGSVYMPTGPGTIIMGAPLAARTRILDGAVEAFGASRPLVRETQVADSGGVRPINAEDGTLGARNTGTVLPVPVTPVAPAPRTVAQATGDVVNGVPRAMLKRYDVREGESIYRIAQDTYGDGTLWTKLLDYNKGKIASNGSMRQGVTLLLPPKEALLGKPLPTMVDSPKVEPSPTTRPATKPDPRSDTKAERAVAANKTYTVQKGDSLSDIAKKTLGSSRRWNEIVDMNKGVLDDENTLVVGLTLKLPSH